MHRIIATAGFAAGLALASCPAAHADPLTDAIAALFGGGPVATPQDGPGSGTGIADSE